MKFIIILDLFAAYSLVQTANFKHLLYACFVSMFHIDMLCVNVHFMLIPIFHPQTRLSIYK